MVTTHSDTQVNSLVINKMTQAQYDDLQNKSTEELYLIEDTNTYLTQQDISTDVSTDASSDIKTVSPKAVKTYVDGICGTILTRLQGI